MVTVDVEKLKMCIFRTSNDWPKTEDFYCVVTLSSCILKIRENFQFDEP